MYRDVHLNEAQYRESSVVILLHVWITDLLTDHAIDFATAYLGTVISQDEISRRARILRHFTNLNASLRWGATELSSVVEVRDSHQTRDFAVTVPR